MTSKFWIVLLGLHKCFLIANRFHFDSSMNTLFKKFIECEGDLDVTSITCLISWVDLARNVWISKGES